MDAQYSSFDHQPELFESWNPELEKRSRSLLAPNTTITMRLGYEHLTLIAVAVAMGILASFAFGFDRGQRIIRQVTHPAPALSQQPSEPKNTSTAKSADYAAQQAITSQPAGTAAKTVVAQKRPTKAAAVTVTANRYAIQVASYRKHGDASAEATKLKRAGYSVVTTATKGQFTVVLVGAYPSRTEASNQLPLFRKRYRDCFIKELSHESTS